MFVSGIVGRIPTEIGLLTNLPGLYCCHCCLAHNNFQSVNQWAQHGKSCTGQVFTEAVKEKKKAAAKKAAAMKKAAAKNAAAKKAAAKKAAAKKKAALKKRPSAKAE